MPHTADFMCAENSFVEQEERKFYQGYARDKHKIHGIFGLERNECQLNLEVSYREVEKR